LKTGNDLTPLPGFTDRSNAIGCETISVARPHLHASHPSGVYVCLEVKIKA